MQGKQKEEIAEVRLKKQNIFDRTLKPLTPTGDYL